MNSHKPTNSTVLLLLLARTHTLVPSINKLWPPKDLAAEPGPG